MTFNGLAVARVVLDTTAEGPGHRFAVWVQGCAIRCDGCFNPHLWKPSKGTLTDPRDLADQAIAAGVEGVTLLGGEPFEQAGPLAEFATLVGQEGMSVMTFTGHTVEDLRRHHSTDIESLLGVTDLLVDGPYQADNPDLVRPWVGSMNQRFHFLTERYRDLADTLTTLPDRIEVRVAADGSVSVNGWASVNQLDELLAGTAEQPVGRGRVR